jgi:hypothetical protein
VCGAALVEEGSLWSSDGFCQMTALSRLAAVPDRKFQIQDLNDCFNRKRTVAKSGAMTELRDEAVIRSTGYHVCFVWELGRPVSHNPSK